MLDLKADRLLFSVTEQTAEALGFQKPSYLYRISEDPVQKDTILLNYCMDDIERFYTDLRCIDDEAQGRQTEKSATDFVNIFQKFKLAFNLMVRSCDLFSTHFYLL